MESTEKHRRALYLRNADPTFGAGFVEHDIEAAAELLAFRCRHSLKTMYKGYTGETGKLGMRQPQLDAPRNYERNNRVW